MAELKPTTFYTVYGKPQLDESKQQALLFLYQPFIGSEALSLYLNLAGDLTVEGKSPNLMHADLLAAIDNGLAAMVAARERLEGIGLLETYQQTVEGLEVELLYQLYDPLSPTEFFQDPLVSYLLLEKVGERRYQRLVERFRPKQLEKDKLENISKRFREVYRLEEGRFNAASSLLEKTQEDFSFENKECESFDWQLFLQQVKKINLSVTPENKKELIALHLMYGIDELEMTDLVMKAAAGESQGINIPFLRQLLRKEKHVPARTTPVQTSELKPAAVREKELVQEGFSPAVRRVIIESEKIPPVQYLRAIKGQKNGFVTDQEIRLIENLLRRNLFPKSVVNLMLNYILVIKDQASLNRNYLDTIANDWSQRGIKRPEDAMKRVIEGDQLLVKKKTSQISAYRKRAQGRRETLPDHIKQPPKERKLSPEKAAELNRKLAEYLNKEGES